MAGDIVEEADMEIGELFFLLGIGQAVELEDKVVVGSVQGPMEGFLMKLVGNKVEVPGEIAFPEPGDGGSVLGHGGRVNGQKGEQVRQKKLI